MELFTNVIFDAGLIVVLILLADQVLVPLIERRKVFPLFRTKK